MKFYVPLTLAAAVVVVLALTTASLMLGMDIAEGSLP